MAEPLSITDAPTQSDMIIKGEDGYYTFELTKSVNTDIGEGTILAIVKMNDIPGSGSRQELEQTTLSLATFSENTVFIPNIGLVFGMEVASVFVNTENMIFTMRPLGSNDMYRLHADIVSAVQLVLPVNKEAFLAYRPGTKFFVTLDFAPSSAYNTIEDTEENLDIGMEDDTIST